MQKEVHAQVWWQGGEYSRREEAASGMQAPPFPSSSSSSSHEGGSMPGIGEGQPCMARQLPVGSEEKRKAVRMHRRKE